MLFYDGACGAAYIAAESDFPYRPSALFVMDGLIEVCVAVAAGSMPSCYRRCRVTHRRSSLRISGHGRRQVCQSIVWKRVSVALDALIKKLDASVENRGFKSSGGAPTQR